MRGVPTQAAVVSTVLTGRRKAPAGVASSGFYPVSDASGVVSAVSPADGRGGVWSTVRGLGDEREGGGCSGERGPFAIEEVELIPKLLELYVQGRFPFDRLVEFYDLDGINDAAADSESGKVLKPILRIS